ncbi:hypothetical protein DHEL01_v201503 [Diaporthe helianthi]|uniref:Heterokaryon incompatibility domain-containing protein n=1 Tax=Diaporthe helianthi TaxID=158607 RepID=A0A2P5ICA3_DIAHE|nr:hypothetical protein DHEL01_v201503 [Diaporthe helianthi]
MEDPAAPNTEFIHEPLPDPAKYMRLLEVLDDNYSKTIKVRSRLTTWPIDSMPPYHAVSYTWGDPEDNTSILMNDKTLKVRTNCEFALKQIYWYRKSKSLIYRKRHSHLYRETRSEWYTESRYFWVDALCIDQSNDGEKSKQVAMMGSIYKNASHVLSCVGDHADDSLFLFESLYGLTHYLVRPKNVLRYNRDGYTIGGFSFRFRMFHRHTSLHRFGLALARLAVRPYFTRVWILQELQLARHLTILCGQHVLAKEDALHLFRELLKNLEHVIDHDKNRLILLTPHLNFIRHKFLRRHVNHGFPHPVLHGSWLHELPEPCTATISMLRQNYASVKNNLFQLLNEVVSQLQCYDPRDKVYGIISLIDWGDVAPLEPDYTQNHVQVAVKFIEVIVKLGQVEKLTEPIWKYVILVVKLFNLNVDSPGIADGLKARRGPTEESTEQDFQMTPEEEKEAAMRALEGPKIGIECLAWCLSPQDIDKNKSKLQDLEATPPQYPENDALYLPRWASADDWVIQLEHQTPHDLWYGASDPRYQLEPNYIPLLVIGKGVEGRRKARMGYGFYSPLKRFHSPGFKQDDSAEVCFYFDIEDSIIFFWKMKQLYELSIDCKDWMVDFLDTHVSKQETAGLSFAALPSETPQTSKRYEPKFRDDRFWRSNDTLWRYKNSDFVLFDTKARRGWFVNGQVVVLELLCAYLKNIPQNEPFDLSKLNYFEDKSSKRASKVLGDQENLQTPIFRVLKDVEGTPGCKQPLQGQAKVEEKLIVDVLREIYHVLATMDPLKRFPGDLDRFALVQMPTKKSRNLVAKGWDFERIYRTSKAKVYTHVFEKDPGWLEFAKDARAGIIFGQDFGEMLLPRDEECCPYFKIVPKGQDYLAIGMDKVQLLVDKWTGLDEKDKIVARLSHFYAWERGVEPFDHVHGYEEHLEQVDCSCFPVQTFMKVPHYDTQDKDMAILKRRKGRLYSSQDVEDMNVAIHADMSDSADGQEGKSGARGKLRKTGVIVFGNRADPEKWSPRLSVSADAYVLLTQDGPD